MEKLKLGCDLDGVIFDSVPQYLKHIKETTGRSFTPEDVDKHTMGKALGIDGSIVKEAIRATLSRSKLPKTKRIEWLFRALGFVAEPPLPMITSRPPSFKGATELQVLDVFKRVETHLHFTRTEDSDDHGEKSPLIKKLSLELFIEDAPHYAEEIVENSACTVLLFDQPWNQEAKESPRLLRMGDYKLNTQWMVIYHFIRNSFNGKVRKNLK